MSLLAQRLYPVDVWNVLGKLLAEGNDFMLKGKSSWSALGMAGDMLWSKKNLTQP